MKVKVIAVNTPIQGTSRYKKPGMCMWPVLHLSEWLKTSFQDPYQGFFFLGGYKLEENLPSIKNMFKQFWEQYSFVNEVLPQVPERTIPMMLHGDEGRGQVKRPIMILSFQPVIPWAGPSKLNTGKILTKLIAFFVFPL